MVKKWFGSRKTADIAEPLGRPKNNNNNNKKTKKSVWQTVR